MTILFSPTTADECILFHFHCNYSKHPTQEMESIRCGVFQADSRHSNGYELCPSSHRHLSVFIRSGIHIVFDLNGEKQLASRFNLTYRNIDDVWSVNNSEFENYLGQMYPAELEIKDTTESITFVLI